ncbi:DNA gyrase/topoisomerase IV subunit B [Feifania hominis]|uniref:DNA topoisomerase (ATP-hydrolyzing) n=1 Tax=Feifania hominis TaxID=2763660 RepID=A0A926HV85_9FIRM|nr:toprim domain-containing protein [Feifania hominis]MBC8537078.1 DNA topoisomerase [Feifania hominis]
MAKASAKNQYGNESISSLKGADRVRLRPGVIFGSDGLEGCEHSFFEILSNSIDEAREGYGDKIVITRFSDHSIEVEDFGRGVPVEYNPKEERYNWELVYCELYAGGKYNNNDAENYEYSLGLNGLGACATQYASEYMDVTVHRDGKVHRLHFERGENIGGLKSEPAARRQTGTVTRWKPDLEVFNDIAIPAEFFADVLKKQAVVNAGLRFVFRDQQPDGKFETTEYLYENGIVDYVAELAAGRAFTDIQSCACERRGRDRADKPEYKVKMQIAFCFCNENARAEYYHNSSFLEHGGSPDKAVRSAFVSSVDQLAKSLGKYTKNESKLTYQDVADSLLIVINSFSTQTSYENQTKKAINNKFIQECMTEFLKHQLEVYFIENPVEAGKIADQVLINKRSRESAEKTRINIKKKLSGNIDISNRVQKFVDCRTKDVTRRELYIVEGDSALGSCKMGRDAEFQAIMPVRGKILNCLKADFDKIFKSEIIVDLIKVLGCGVEVKTKSNKDFDFFDIDALRWDKVIICTDADVDGFQIRTLILTMLYRLVPSLIDKGKAFIAESPLFEMTMKGKSYFAYDEREKADFLAAHPKEKIHIARSKGLGENEPEMMWETTMNPETRRLIKVTPEDALRTAEVFELLLGDNLAGRKDYIAEYGAQYIELADIS